MSAEYKADKWVAQTRSKHPEEDLICDSKAGEMFCFRRTPVPVSPRISISKASRSRKEKNKLIISAYATHYRLFQEMTELVDVVCQDHQPGS